MKVVIDTNVLVSGIFYHGLPGRILEAWRTNEFVLVVSIEIFAEYQQVVFELAKIHPTLEVVSILEYISRNALFCEALTLSNNVSDDPDDDKFLACALASECQIIVSGDKHLLKVSGYRKIDVLKPRDFVEKYL